MPTKRLTLASPAIDTNGTQFPYVDVRLGFAGTFGVTKAGATISGGFISSPFTAELKVKFYRLASGARIYLAQDYRVQEGVFEAKNRIADPGAGTERDRIANFWDYLYIGGSASLATTYGVNRDHLRDQGSSENPFEALDINSPFNFAPMIDCLQTLLTREGGPDFAGLTVVEDA